MPDQKTNKPNIVEVATKKRHLHLLEKMQTGKTLTRGELRELSRFEKKDIPPGCVDTMERLAKAFNVSLRSVHYWSKDGMPVTPDGFFDLVEIQAWRLLKNKKLHKGNGEEDTHKQWDTKYRQMKAMIAELEYNERMGNLIPKEEVEAGRVQRILSIKKSFLALPQMIAPQLAGLEAREIRVILDKRIREIVESFSREKKTEKKQPVVRSGAGGVAVAAAGYSI